MSNPKLKITTERAEEMLEQLELIYSDLFDAGDIATANTIQGASEHLFNIFDEQGILAK